MDPTLLQKSRMPETLHNNETAQPDETLAEQRYRDLAVEQPSPPVRIKFDPPIEYDGQRYSELVCDFDKMVGKDFQRIEREFTHLYKAEKNETPLPELKHLYHCLVIAHAADVPVGLIFKLPRRYYTPIRLEALKACGSSPDEERA
jgi:hypothetical protein